MTVKFIQKEFDLDTERYTDTDVAYIEIDSVITRLTNLRKRLCSPALQHKLLEVLEELEALKSGKPPRPTQEIMKLYREVK